MRDEWLQAREQAEAAWRDASRELAALHKGVKENGVSASEAALLAGACYGHYLFQTIHGPKREDS